jgi:response regulator of citrate/malate metabolism
MACLKLGIQGYVLKPFQAKTLAETVVGYHRQHKKVKKIS